MSYSRETDRICHFEVIDKLFYLNYFSRASARAIGGEVISVSGLSRRQESGGVRKWSANSPFVVCFKNNSGADVENSDFCLRESISTSISLLSLREKCAKMPATKIHIRP